MEANPIAAPLILVVARFGLTLQELVFQSLIHLVRGGSTAVLFQKIEPGDGTKSIGDVPLFADGIFSRLGRENEFIYGSCRCFNHLTKFSARN